MNPMLYLSNIRFNEIEMLHLPTDLCVKASEEVIKESPAFIHIIIISKFLP